MQLSANPFRKVGFVLVVLGIIDIGYMVYCIINELTYTSSFNIFAVVAGIFLIKGNLIAALITRFFTTFFVFLLFSIAILYFYLIPIDLITVQIKLQTLSMLKITLAYVLMVGILVWMTLQFSKNEAVSLYVSQGYKPFVTKLISFSAAGAGVLIITIIGVVLHFAYNSKTAVKALQLAEDQFGSDYRYHVTTFNFENEHGVALVTAYNSETIKTVKVEW